MIQSKKNFNFFSLNINFLPMIFLIAHRTRNYSNRIWEIWVACSFFIFYKCHRVTYVARSNGFNTPCRLCINRSQKLSWSLQLIRTRIKWKKKSKENVLPCCRNESCWRLSRGCKAYFSNAYKFQRMFFSREKRK